MGMAKERGTGKGKRGERVLDKAKNRKSEAKGSCGTWHGERRVTWSVPDEFWDSYVSDKNITVSPSRLHKMSFVFFSKPNLLHLDIQVRFNMPTHNITQNKRKFESENDLFQISFNVGFIVCMLNASFECKIRWKSLKKIKNNEK